MDFSFYLRVTGKDQGLFASEEPSAGEGRSLCYRFFFEGRTTNEPRGGAAVATRSHEPISVVKAWGESSPQFMQAFWQNEVLTEVELEFVRKADSASAASPFEQIVLKNATIAFIKRRAGHEIGSPPGAPFELEEIGFRFEEMSMKNVRGKKVAKYHWKNAG